MRSTSFRQSANWPGRSGISAADFGVIPAEADLGYAAIWRIDMAVSAD